MEMTNWKYILIPDDWLSAARAAHDMGRVVRNTSYATTRRVIGFGLPMLIGVVIGIIFHAKISSNISESVLTLSGVLAGFVVTQMLFTGRVAGAELLGFEDVKEYAEKIIYLLWSQVLTLMVYLATALVALGHMTVDDKTPEVIGLMLSALLIGFLSVAIIRTVLLPYQIYEIHRFSLNALIHEKEKLVNEEKRRKLAELNGQ